MIIPQNTTFKVSGIMSGTSLDGLDLAACSFRFAQNGKWEYAIEHAATYPFSPTWKHQLQNLIDADARAIARAHFDFGRLIGEYANRFHAASGFEPMLIASHGHTIFHDPATGYTTQIGNGAAIAAITGKPAVCDFRATDVCLGGQGAPLVPIGDELLFPDYDACLNLGGFSNISFRADHQRIAFDVCPVNIILNLLAMELGQDYDADGRLAAKGKVIPGLLEVLNSLPYYSQLSPKSMGVEWLKDHVLPLMQNEDHSTCDKLRTFTEHIALQISRVLTENRIKNVLITGGGAHNQFLIERLQAKTTCGLILPDHKTIDYKEALVFALLGLLRWFEQENCLATATGASHSSIGGAIYLPVK
ncbi:MAG TPA: anhydro-N-acetylmuramic acid kinase [Bacteroidales bacterium]|nr:anhydro-N-acetylmuramic acid kinase [Bacteroidales bacterium]